MIRNSFCFLDRIRDESRIWKQGVKDWQGFLNCEKVVGVSARKKKFFDRKIVEAFDALGKD